jgi:glycine dehydrogenase
MSNFMSRHIGPQSIQHIEKMLTSIGVSSTTDLLHKVYPTRKHVDRPKNRASGIGVEKTEEQALHQLKQMMNKNTPTRSYLGQGFHGAIMPEPIKRHLLENPKWYTAYTPYQSEISQGRLESQFLFQEAVKDLTGLSIANVSLLDEASAAAEAISLCYRTKHPDIKTPFIFMLDTIHPHVRAAMITKCRVLGINISLCGESINGITGNFKINECIGCFFQYPDTLGELSYKSPLVGELLETCKKNNNIPIVALTDPLALTLFKSPDELGANISLGSAGRLGMPMWFGGPHPAYFAAGVIVLPFKQGSNISNEHGHQAISALHNHYLVQSQQCFAYIMDLTDCVLSVNIY